VADDEGAEEIKADIWMMTKQRNHSTWPSTTHMRTSIMRHCVRKPFDTLSVQVSKALALEHHAHVNTVRFNIEMQRERIFI